MNTLPLLNSFHFPSTINTSPSDSITIPYGNNRQVIIQIDNLLCMEASGNYTFIYTHDGNRYLASKTLKSYVTLLDPISFIRIHKSWIINTKHLKGLCEYDRSVKMHGGKEIAISRRRIREVSLLLASHLK